MNTWHTKRLGGGAAAAVLLACMLAMGCGEDGDGDGGTGSPDGSTGMDGSTSGMDASTGTDGSITEDGALPGDDGSIPGTDGGIPDGAVVLPDGGGVCFVATCSGTVWACGNCVDDDGDGLVDSADPDCVGACDNNEAGYRLDIPGSDTPNCNLDCYYDEDQGSGNDRCVWNSSCDPEAPEDPRCPFTGPGGSVSCPDPQSEDCHTNCDPITPNGCDCFGCCELPAGSGSYVFLGSRSTDGSPPCSADTATNPDSCRACTPVEDCLNTCERCELCLGRTIDDLDCDCFDRDALPPRCVPDVDAGVPPPIDAGLDAGPPPDVDAGPPPPSRCDDGVQECGFPGDDPCPMGFFCQTGCCVFFG